MEETKSEYTISNSKKKREDKLRRRDPRALENVLKAINALPESEKIQTLVTKYAELYEESKNLQTSLTVSEKHCQTLQREKAQLQSEQSKLVLARVRMEGLSRELQRQNKLIKEENLAKIREEEERRKEVATKFQSSLDEITNMMQENNEKNVKLRDDNLEMAHKLETLCDQFQKRQGQLTRMAKQMDLERQLSEAALEKAQFELQVEREVWVKEREMLQMNLQKSEENCNQLHSNIKSLEEHLQIYTGKYEEFETTISKSNTVFDNCKAEMVKMTKQITILEKESKTWKGRYQKNAQILLDLSTAKQSQDTQLVMTEKKVEQLQKLCRQLQADRIAYLKLLKNNGIEPTQENQCEEQIQESPQTLTKKEQELQFLKENLKALQDQLVNIQDNPNPENVDEEMAPVTLELNPETEDETVCVNNSECTSEVPAEAAIE